MDTDGSGELSFDELKKVLRKAGYTSTKADVRIHFIFVNSRLPGLIFVSIQVQFSAII